MRVLLKLWQTGPLLALESLLFAALVINAPSYPIGTIVGPAAEASRNWQNEQIARAHHSARRLVDDERLIRGSLRSLCSRSDQRLECERFEAMNAANAPPFVYVSGIRCTEAWEHPEGHRRCQFTAWAERERRPLDCTVTYHERPGDHARYWSDHDLTASPPPSRGDLPQAPFYQSSLRCSGEVRGLL